MHLKKEVEMRKSLFIAVASILILGFSSLAWSSSLSGTDWDVRGKASAKMKIKGEGSESDKGTMTDWFTFYSDGDFDCIDFWGTWTQDAKGKFIVNFSDDSIESFLEDIFWDAAGIDVRANVEKKSFKGKYKDKNGQEAIKGKYTIEVSFYNSFYDIYGSLKYKFIGIPLDYSYADQVASPDNNRSSQLKAVMLDAIQEAIGQQDLSE
jgi:hypothetical protein